MSASILVVDDDVRILDILSRTLKREGYLVRTAGDGEQALHAIEQQLPDLVLLDVTMPGIDGFEVCRRLREHQETQLLPVAMITGLNDSDSRIRGLEIGADDFLHKPFEHAVLLARIRSLLRVKRLTDQLESTERVIFTLARTVEAKDDYTEGHLWRLAEYSHCVAKALGCDAEQARYIRYGGILHDIGKIGINEAILKKPGSLTPEEFAEIKRHPTIGAEIVSPMRFAPVVGPIIESHHERWDGNGYPNALGREHIPLGARIIAVVDAFDAMTTTRPYRKALPLEEATRRLLAGRDMQWEGRIVDTFLNLLQRGALPTFNGQWMERRVL